MDEVKNSEEPQALNDRERVFEKGVQVGRMEFEDYMSFMIYCEGIAGKGEVVVSPHTLDLALMFLGFCRAKRGRALLAQAATGIDAAAANPEEAGDSVEADVQTLLGEGAKTACVVFCPMHDRQGEASLEGGERNSTPH